MTRPRGFMRADLGASRDIKVSHGDRMLLAKRCASEGLGAKVAALGAKWWAIIVVIRPNGTVWQRPRGSDEPVSGDGATWWAAAVGVWGVSVLRSDTGSAYLVVREATGSDAPELTSMHDNEDEAIMAAQLVAGGGHG